MSLATLFLDDFLQYVRQTPKFSNVLHKLERYFERNITKISSNEDTVIGLGLISTSVSIKSWILSARVVLPRAELSIYGSSVRMTAPYSSLDTSK